MSSSKQDASNTPPPASRPWYQRIGPGIITACVVIGPGSILSSSKVGATSGFALSWVVVLAVGFMMIYMMLGARLGVAAGQSPATLLTERVGRWLAALIGVGVFFISAAFQFGNNIGVHSAFKEYEQYITKVPFMQVDYVVVLFNVLAISFVFGFRNMYRALERLMMVFVGMMLLSFAINLFFAKPDLVEFFAGFVPVLGIIVSGQDPADLLNISLLALVSTTFVITAAYNQAYLVQQKGWGKEDLKDGLLDARIGSVIMGLITIMLMSTAAAALRGQELAHVHDVASGLRPAFGAWGHTLFCLGLFSAAYSSFLVNSMIGGFILADGLGLGSKPSELGPKIFTTVVLLTGMIVALLVLKANFNPVPAIVAAQAVTVLAAPLVAGALWWLTNRPDIMGSDRNSTTVNVLAGIGFVLLLAMAAYTAGVSIPTNVKKLRQPQSATIPTTSDQATVGAIPCAFFLPPRFEEVCEVECQIRGVRLSG
ncbi:MAG: Nramp family divalent metal transporter [Planctomycetaceae bacterium]|nr:Nramp family divalent metal transporter [Planctomycetales bacterium]MCB9927668.1 Nramp family divalent metal transporter [Planctomycetaceae bacterium]